MVVKVTVVSTKGGIGKTSTTVNVGAVLADLGQKVLLIDGDVQPSLSSYYPITVRAPYGLLHADHPRRPLACHREGATEVICESVVWLS